MQLTFNKKVFDVEHTKLPIGSIEPNPSQPRKLFTHKSLRELKDSILQNNGIIEPVLVERVSEQMFMLIDGERRYKIYKEIGWELIPAYVILNPLTNSDRFMIWHCIHDPKLNKSWTMLEREQLIVDATKTIGVQKTSEIFNIGEQTIKRTFEVVELARTIKRRQPVHFAKEILSLPKEVRDELQELILHKINTAKIHSSKDVRLVRKILWHAKAKTIFMQKDSDISDASIYIYLQDFKERLIMNKPQKTSVDYDNVSQLEFLLNKILGED